MSAKPSAAQTAAQKQKELQQRSAELERRLAEQLAARGAGSFAAVGQSMTAEFSKGKKSQIKKKTESTNNYEDDEFEEEDEEEEAEEEEYEEDYEEEDEEAEEEEEEDDEDEDEEDEEDEEEVAPKKKASKTMLVKLARSNDAAVKTIDVAATYTPKTFKALIAEVAKKCGTDSASTVLRITDAEGDVVELDDARSLSRLLAEKWPGKNGNPKTGGAALKIYVGDATNPVILGSVSSLAGNLATNSVSSGSATINATTKASNPFAANNTEAHSATLLGATTTNNTFRAASGFFDSTMGGVGGGMGSTVVMPGNSTLLEWTRMKLLGKGSFGTVHEGITNDGKLMAVKTVELPQEKARDENDSELLSLRAEINLMTQLKHPHIVAYYGCQTIELESGAHLFEIFMEHCHGGSLTSLRKKFSADGKLKIALARTYIYQILQGLKYLHANQVIHRDIKSDNVLISASGEAKLADFGCSKRLSTAAVEAGAQTVVGSPLFMAPEVLTGTDEGYSFGADVWSVGCLLLELLGRKPWTLSGNNAYQLMFQISQSKTMPTGVPDNCPPLLKDFFSRVFERDASKRATAEELLEHPWMTCPASQLEEVEALATGAKSDLK